jgi:hypothetical protein
VVNGTTITALAPGTFQRLHLVCDDRDRLHAGLGADGAEVTITSINLTEAEAASAGGGHRRGLVRDDFVTPGRASTDPGHGRAAAVTIFGTEQTGEVVAVGVPAAIGVMVVNAPTAGAAPERRACWSEGR